MIDLNQYVFQEVNKREALISSQDRAIRTLNSQIASVEEMIAKSAETMSLMRESYAAISEDIGGLDNKIEVRLSVLQHIYFCCRRCVTSVLV